MNVNYRLAGGLSSAQMEKIHHAALNILDEIGMEVNARQVPTAVLLERMAAQPGVRVAGHRVYFSPQRVEAYLADFKNQRIGVSPAEPSPPLIHTGSHTFHYLHPLADAAVPHTVATLTESARLTNAMFAQSVRGGCPGWPGDVAPDLRELMSYKITCVNCRTHAAPSIMNVRLAPFFYEMTKVVEATADNQYLVGFHPISPLKLEGDEFEIALFFWKKFGDKLCVSCGPMPIMGVSAPIYLTASLAQSVAEALGAFTFFKILTNGGKIDFFFNVYAFDMKYGSFVYGGPEDALIALARNQMTQWYGMPNNAGNKALNTMGHLPDSQSAGEKAAKTVMALLAGAASLAGAGGLSLDEVFSPEQLVIDVEIVNWARHVAEGFEFDEKTLNGKIIRDVIKENGSFIDHDTTLNYHRRTYWQPKLFEHLMLSQWNEKGKKTLRQRANERIGAIMADADYRIDPDREKELETIYQKAEKLVV